MPKPTITIIGAGISGLTLARCLKHRGIRAVIYEKDNAQRASQRHGYGITLWAYRPLLNFLGLSEAEFKRRCAVDAAVEGSGCVRSTMKSDGVVPFRAHRQTLERMLGEGLDVQWDCKLLDVKEGGGRDSNGRLHVSFNNDRSLETDVLVAADGPHSEVRRYVAPSASFKILPFAVYNGKRRVSKPIFDEKYLPFMDGLTTIEHSIGSTHLTLAIDNHTTERVSMSYTFSRPTQADDPLARPDRPNSGATDIPEAFFDEVGRLSALPAPFDQVFHVDQMHNDRLLHWLMRSVLPKRAGLDKGAEQGVVLLADAAHHGPILGTDGANVAIEDAVVLADLLAKGDDMNLRTFYEERFERWERYVEENERALEDMHGGTRSVL